MQEIILAREARFEKQKRKIQSGGQYGKKEETRKTDARVSFKS